MLQDFKNIFVNVKKDTKLYRFEKIPKELNDIHISMSVTDNLKGDFG